MPKNVYQDLEVNFGFQVVLSTIPNQKDFNFEKDIEEHYFSEYHKSVDKHNKHLYNPLKFYILGNYDVCYISLIDNFKFSHRLFEPKGKNDETVYNDHAFQSYSGFALNKPQVLKGIFDSPPENYFVGIINLKLNNGLLIGNGLSYLEAVIDLVNKSLPDTEHLMFQTFSWFELSLIVFIDKPKDLSKILSDLRLAEFKDLDHVKFDLKNSLYDSLFTKSKEITKISKTSVFSDTNTYFGFNEKLIKGNPNEKYFIDFKKLVDKEEIELKTKIEWHVKPGHIKSLEHTLKESEDFGKLFNSSERQFVLGKSDYLLESKDTDVISNIELIKYIICNDYCELFKDIRRIKTHVYLDTKCINNAKPDSESPLLWLDKLNKLCVTSNEFNEIDSTLKTLKISRQVRNKTLKLLSNYNNGIQNPILFPYFLDFTVFIENLKRLINDGLKRSKSTLITVRELEKQLNENIKVFQEGYNVRYLNGYHFENISDFDLDFNNSIQQLLSSYGTFVYEYGKYFYPPDNSEISNEYSPIIQLNDIDTASNDLSINYSVHHLTSPEFVFSTILKELLNNLGVYNNNLNERVLNTYEKNLKDIKYKINESYLDDMFDSGLIEINYFIIDCIRFAVTFNYDFDLFFHWFWSYNFQNSALFNTSGMINEERLKMELFRIAMVKNFFGVNKKMHCPTPEIYSYWKRHYKKVDKVSKKFLKKIDKNGGGFFGFINDTITNYLEYYKEIEEFHVKTAEAFDNIRGMANELDVNRINPLAINKFAFNLLNDEDKKLNKNMFFIDSLMLDLLTHHYSENKERITTLKRDWEKGIPLANFGVFYKDILYSIDQRGGVYFYQAQNTIDYFKYNAGCLLKIIDFSLKQKRNFISTRINKNEIN